MIVDFPAPVLPTHPIFWPGWTCRLRSFDDMSTIRSVLHVDLFELNFCLLWPSLLFFLLILSKLERRLDGDCEVSLDSCNGGHRDVELIGIALIPNCKTPVTDNISARAKAARPDAPISPRWAFAVMMKTIPIAAMLYDKSQ